MFIYTVNSVDSSISNWSHFDFSLVFLLNNRGNWILYVDYNNNGRLVLLSINILYLIEKKLYVCIYCGIDKCSPLMVINKVTGST